jgi:leucyl aminopeptidase
MEIEVVRGAEAGVDADLHAIGLPEGQELPDALRSAPGAGDVRTAYRKTALVYPQAGRRVLVIGLGPREDLDGERLRVAGAIAAHEAARLEAASIAWGLPETVEAVDRPGAAASLVEGTILGSYTFERYKSESSGESSVTRLAIAAGDGADADAIAEEARVSGVAARAANRARELQNLPSNVATPSYLAERAEELAAEFASVSAEVLGPAQIAELGMGGLAAVAAGSAADPRFIILRHAGGTTPTLGLVGKAVTFDSGGISIKPSAKMEEMKMDMSGGAAVLEGVAAIAELGLPIDVAACVPATENMPSGTATKPGDIITQLNGKTVEVNNTDAEGRLILADALTYCVRELGAERVVDLATLTGAVLVALGSTYAALLSNDDGWAGEVADAAERTGELAWRLPLHPEYKELTKGSVADLTNASAKRKAGTIYAASFLEEFVDERPWVHLDIAGTAWDVGREYVGKGPTGFGVRLLVALARELAGAGSSG